MCEFVFCRAPVSFALPRFQKAWCFSGHSDDRLAAMDQGVLADIAGNALWDARPLVGVRSSAAALTMAQSTLTWQANVMVNANYGDAKFASA